MRGRPISTHPSGWLTRINPQALFKNAFSTAVGSQTAGRSREMSSAVSRSLSVRRAAPPSSLSARCGLYRENLRTAVASARGPALVSGSRWAGSARDSRRQSITAVSRWSNSLLIGSISPVLVCEAERERPERDGPPVEDSEKQVHRRPGNLLPKIAFFNVAPAIEVPRFLGRDHKRIGR